jgi:hypothetical protein
MQAEFSVELGSDDPTLAVPWSDPEERWRYFDLQAHPEQIANIEEAQTFNEIRDFLSTMNSAGSPFASAKCDAWFSEELTEEESVFGALCKFGSYVDLVFRGRQRQESFADHEDFGMSVMRLLRAAPELPASFEIVVRRAHYADDPNHVRHGFYFTLYVNGFGDDEAAARQSWGIGLRLVSSACVQLSARAGNSRRS